MQTILLASDVHERGGAAMMLSLLARTLDPARFRVTVALPVDPPIDSIAEELAAAGIPVERLAHTAPRDPRGAREFRSIIDAVQPDLVHIHLPHSGSGRMLLAGAHQARIPIVATEHDPFRLSLPKRLVKRLTLRWTRISICISDWAREFLAQEYHLPFERTARVWNGISAERFAAGTLRTEEHREIRSHGLVLFTNAALHPRKGLATLLEAIHTIQGERPDVLLLIVGEGPHEEELVSLARRRGVAERVRFLGWRNDVPDLLACSDIVVQPSIREAFGLAVAEAMAAGKPVVATEVGGHVDLIAHGETGLLVPVDDPTSIAVSVLRLAENEALRARLGAEARERVAREFTAQRMAERTARVYDRILSLA